MTQQNTPADAGPPRDFRGHGANPPHARWPGDARIAININLNFEAGLLPESVSGDGAEQCAPSQRQAKEKLVLRRANQSLFAAE